ncbi:MAG: hypothetical protein WCB92_24015, partial [Mycobacterium sp.]
RGHRAVAGYPDGLRALSRRARFIPCFRGCRPATSPDQVVSSSAARSGPGASPSEMIHDRGAELKSRQTG